MKRNQSGFSIVEIIMAIVIIGLLGAVGWLYWDKVANKPTDTKPLSATNATSTQSNSNNPMPILSTFDDTSVKTMLTSFYNSWDMTDTDQSTSDKAIAQYGSKRLIAYKKYQNELADKKNQTERPADLLAYDFITCAQNSYSKVAVSNVAVNENKATATVTLTYADPQVLTVSVINENGPKLDTINAENCKSPY